MFLFANVGSDSENPATLNYVQTVAAPFAENSGLLLHQLERQRRDGTTETLMQRLNNPSSRSIPIPIRMTNGAPGRRSCTADFKIKVIGRWLRQHGASVESPATVAIGISLDEIHRANRRRCDPYERIEYPLLDLKLAREDCERVIASAGLPVPPRSSCFFCPFQTLDSWKRQRQNEPDLFAKSVQLEQTLNERRAALGRDPAYLSRFGRPLPEAIPIVDVAGASDDPDGGECDSGWCAT
ncbi:phosphoadenosine phosphosulfate reductase [Actinosynnema sp. NPDC023794]